MNRYPLEELSKEVAFLAYYFHWSKDEIMELSHLERRRWVEQVSRLNKEINESQDAQGGGA